MVIQRGVPSSWATPLPNTHQSQQSTHLVASDLNNCNSTPSSLKCEPAINIDSIKSEPLEAGSDLPASNTSIATHADMIEWKNTFNMRQVTLTNLAASQLGLRSSFKSNLPLKVRERCMTSTAKSLDILRKNLQAAINKEFDGIIKKYLENFFQPAVDNIRANLGSNSVSEDHVRDVCRAILEEAKQMYRNESQSRGSSPYNELSDSETGSLGEYRFGRPSPLFRKRKESDTDSEASQSVRRKKSKPRLPSQLQVGQSALKQVRGEPIRREGPKWDPSRINQDTLFVMGARANKVLGFGQTRGRLYIKHPGLLKYSGDQEDKEWLSGHNLMPPTGGKAYLMVLEDIQELALTDEYRNNPNLILHELKGFHAPEFMLKKIRAYVNHMNTGSNNVEPDFCDLGLSLNEANLLMVNTAGLSAECILSAMTPPPTVLEDSGPSTPSEALELLECSSIAALAANHLMDSQYIRLHAGTHGLSPTVGLHQELATWNSQVDSLSASHATLSALLAGHFTYDSSLEGLVE